MLTRRSLVVIAGISVAVLIAIFARPVAAQRGSVLYTSALFTAGVNNYLACSANNVASTPRTITVDLVHRDFGTVLATYSQAVEPGFGIETTTSAAAAYCKITVTNGGPADVRGGISHIVVTDIGGAGSNVTTAAMAAW